jgi:aminopeptidase N
LLVSLTLAEARDRADQLSAIEYDIALDLAGPRDATTFGCRTTIRFDTRSPETFLELTGATDLRLTVNGAATTPAYDGKRLTLSGLADSNEVVVEARVPYVTDGDGMHTFTDPADGERYVSAYLGMDIAQRVFPCFDQPDLKAPIGLTVTADPAWTVVANGRVTGNDAGEWAFATTPPVSTYLFVVCAGPWHSVTWVHELDGRRVPFGWHARRSLAAELDRDADELRATTTACFDHYAGLFDEPFAFDSYDQAFVPGQNWGALETPGCVTYRDELLPRVRITDQDRMRRGTIIAHEMAHMWFGNLVTMRWWEDTWLNESFADYMGFRVGAAAAGFKGTLVAFESQRKPGAYDADERRSTHPVAPAADDVPDVDAAFSNFDSISYAKGNSVLRQLVTWLGDEDFLAGVNAHLTRHRFGNATLADFVEALDAASARDVRGWVEAWLRTTGFDTLAVERDGDVPVLVHEGERQHRVHVAAYDDALRERGSRLVDLGSEPVRFDDWAGLVVVPNAHGETFARIRLDERSRARVAAGLAGLDDDLTRAVLWASLFDLVAIGELTPDAYLALVARHLPAEREVAIVEATLNRTTRFVIPQRVTAERAAAAVEAVAAACLSGLRPAPGEQLAVAFTRGLATTSHDADLLLDWLDADATDTGVALDPELRWRVVRRLAEIGAIDEGTIAAEEVRDPSMGGELGAAAARAARPEIAAKEAAWAAMVEDEQVSNRRFEYLAAGLWSVEQAELLRPFVRRYLTETPAVAERRGQAFCGVVGDAFPQVALDDEQLDLLRTALAGDLPPVLRRDWEDRYDDLVRARG